MIGYTFPVRVRPTLKKCWFAVLLPTDPKQALPQKMYCLSENLFFSSYSVNRLFFKIIKSCILIEERLQRLLLLHSYLIYSICRPPKAIVKRGHKIMVNFFKKKRHTCLPKLKLMGRTTANKYIFKDGLSCFWHSES